MIRITKEQLKKFTPEILVAIFALISSSAMTWYVHKLGLTLALTDQSAHLNFARLTFDSFTPGLSQIGFWPPLLHILMIPAVIIWPLFFSGLAGFFTLFPFLILGSVLLYRTLLLFTQKKIYGVLGILIFLLNPYVLYYTATPMMEVLFIVNLIIVAYFFSLWVINGRLRDIIFCGVFVSFASLSRFEGLILIPIVAILVLANLLRRRKRYAEIEATEILFGFLAILGLIFILFFSRAYSDSFFTFAGGGWWLRSPVEGEGKEMQGNVYLTAQYVFHGLYYMLGKPLTWISFFAGIANLIIFRKRLDIIGTFFILLGPLVFVAYSMFRGSTPMYLPEISSIKVFLNERYVLSGVAFSSFAIPMFLYGFYKCKLEFLRKLLVVVFSAFILYFLIIQLYSVVFVGSFQTIRQNVGVPSEGQLLLAEYLKDNYDYGKVLAVRVDNDPVFPAAKLPLDIYIHEANFKYYNQVFHQPWLFARWVIMYNSDDTTDKWAKLTEPVSVRWRNDFLFKKYYELVYVNNKKELYRIREDVVREMAKSEGYDVQMIPSINPSLKTWDESKIVQQIGIDR